MERQELRWVDVNELLVQAPYPPREESLSNELVTTSVRLHGVLVPLLARQTDEGLQVINGQRRLLAARDCDIDQVPVFVAEIGDAEAIRCYLSDNSCRRELSESDHRVALDQLSEIRHQAEDEKEVDVDSSGSSRVDHGPRALSAVSSKPEQREKRVQSLLTRTDVLFQGIAHNRTVDSHLARSIAKDVLALRQDGGVLRPHEVYTNTSEPWLVRHSLWVASLNTEFAPDGFSDLGAEGYALAGLLHDIGMIFLEAHFVEGQAPLAFTDRRRLHTHTRVAYAIIHSLGKDWAEVALAARDHHERLNGSGYPGGLKQHEISRVARVTALTDSFASLMGPRPFREPETMEAARRIIAKDVEAGDYDPTLFPILHATSLTMAADPRPAENEGRSRSWSSRTPTIEFV